METAMNGNTVPQFNDLSSLKQRRDEIKSQIDELQQSMKIVNNSLRDMFEETDQMELAQQGKDFGQTTINTGDHKVTIDFRKRVDWDQDKLVEALNRFFERLWSLDSRRVPHQPPGSIRSFAVPHVPKREMSAQPVRRTTDSE